MPYTPLISEPPLKQNLCWLVVLHVIYRTTAKENMHQRPDFYSKVLCAQSMVAALRAVSRVSLTVLNDGDPSPALPVLQDVATQVIEQEAKGNAASMIVALRMALDWEDSDWVYFVEDDYFHTGDAIECLEAGINGLPEAVPYVTLYEHPNCYAGKSTDGRDFVYLTGSRYWRTVTSTCMTFAVRVANLRSDLAIHAASLRSRTPNDYGLWLVLQGAPKSIEHPPLSRTPALR